MTHPEHEIFFFTRFFLTAIDSNRKCRTNSLYKRFINIEGRTPTRNH